MRLLGLRRGSARASPRTPAVFCLPGPTLPIFLDFSTSLCSAGGIVTLILLPVAPDDSAMKIHACQPLFAWSELEDSPSLQTIRGVLDSLPAQALLDGLQQARGHGRNDYPCAVLGGVVVLSVLCRHLWLNDTLAELHRNPPLCRILGIRK